ncbi:trigger factor [Agaricicola taiwanensis]|nr:trigger factor [Agaricicola taiwanensis]
MQVTQTSSEGLKREFKITIPATDLDAKLSERLESIKDRVRINGFRPGKVPTQHLRRIYGKQVMGEVLQEMIGESNRRIVEENDIKLAMQPNIKLPEDEAEIARVMEAKGDLVFDVALEVLPKIEIADLKGIKAEKPVADVTDTEINETLDRIAKQNRPFSPKEKKGAKAAEGDRLTVDFKGEIDGTPFEGGSGEDMTVEIGAGNFIPGFEEKLVGAKAGETRDVEISFPADYGRADLAGKPVKFTVTVKQIEAPGEMAIDDELAKAVGMESLDKLKDAVKEQHERELALVSRQRLKRELLDALDERHSFELPPTLVEQEFAVVWNQVERDLAQSGKTLADEGKTEDEAKAEYKKIAERRVRLGLVLAEIGEKNDIKVSEDEVTRAVVDRARQFPGREQQVWEFYRNNPDALAELRAPLFEEKVIDYIAGLAEVTEKKVTRDELIQKDDEADAA